MRARATASYIVGLTAIVSFAVAAPAPAATISYDSSVHRVRYIAAPGEANAMTVSQTGSDYVFEDSPAIAITNADGLASPCQVDPLSPNVARCLASAVNRISLHMGDMDDAVNNTVSVGAGTVIFGGDGYDHIDGGPGVDKIYGGPGADYMNGHNGDDLIDTGYGGYDPLHAECDYGACLDEARYESGFDTLSYASRGFPVYVDARSARFAGGYAVDSPDPTCMTDPNVFNRPDCEMDFVAGESHDEKVEKIVGGTGNDELIGNKANNTLVGGPGADTMCGELGEDTVDYSGDTAAVTVSLDGNPTMPTDPKLLSNEASALNAARKDCRTTTASGAPTPPGTAPRDCVANDGTTGEHDCVGQDVEDITGGSGNDTLIGNNPDAFINDAPPVEPRGANLLDGGPGNDTLDGLLGPDVLKGGSNPAAVAPDVDTVTYAGRSEDVSATIDGKGNDGSAVDPVNGILGDGNPFNDKGDEIEADVENVIGGDGNDTLGGSTSDNVLTGGEGNDTIDGHAGDDTIDAGNGDDTLAGSAGNDTLNAGNGDDGLDGGAGGDLLNGGDGNDTLHGGVGPDTLLGGPGGDDLADWSDATSGVSVTAGGGADDGTAGEGDNVAGDIESANGGLADDHLVLGQGDGFIDGGAGNDTIDGGPGADQIKGGAGLDTVDYSARTTPLSVDVNSPGGDGEAGENDDVLNDVETILGGAAGDTLIGGPTASVLMGNGGSDQLAGGGGDDQLFGGADSDALDGGDANDTLSGGDANDTLLGQSGTDTLKGDAGDDTLDGGSGRDSVGGGSGADRAVYASRTKTLTLDLHGNSDSGESGERDVIKLDVEATTAGRGNDAVNSKNRVKNSVSCGPGTDQILADTIDDIAGDCERIMNPNPCKVSPEPAQMSTKGVATIKVSCTDDAAGSLLLKTASAVKTGKRARAKKVSLGRASFKAKRGQSLKLKVRIKGTGKRVIKRNKSGISARATLTVRQSFGVRALSTKTGDKLTIRAKR